MRNAKILPLLLERELYERIERDALEQERDPVQQVRFLIKLALGAQPARLDRPSDPTTVEAVR